MEKHPNRSELIAAAKAESSIFADHLTQCEDCRNLFALYRAFPMAGEVPLPDAPTGWIIKAKEIAESANPLTALKGIAARLSFDSWKIPVAVGVRSQGGELDRRLRFEVGPLAVDLRAEQQPSGWDFTAQISGELAQTTTISLVADKQTVVPNVGGFYQWSSPKPPKQIHLRADDLQLELPELMWKPTPRT